MNTFDELQSLRNEVARLRQENGDLGEKLGAALHRLAALEEFAETCRDDFDCDQDAHRHNTICRACTAQSLVGRAKCSNFNGPG